MIDGTYLALEDILYKPLVPHSPFLLLLIDTTAARKSNKEPVAATAAAVPLARLPFSFEGSNKQGVLSLRTGVRIFLPRVFKQN